MGAAFALCVAYFAADFVCRNLGLQGMPRRYYDYLEHAVKLRADLRWSADLRTAASAKLIGKEDDRAHVRLPSGEVRIFRT